MKLKIITSGIMVSTLLMGLWSCKQDISPSIVIDTSIDIWIRDANKHNLLDSTTTNYYKASEIRIFNLVNGVKKEVFNPMMDAPRNFLILKNESNGEYAMRLFPNEGVGKVSGEERKDELTTTYIHWRENKVDTLDCTITRIWSSIYCTKIMYNGVLKYDELSDQSVLWGDVIVHRFIQITE
jgi:hypothetical protein